MAKINSYEEDAHLNGDEKLIGTDSEDSSKTKNYPLNLLKTFFSGGSTLKTSGPVTLTAIPSQLPYDINKCSFTGGKAYLPDTTVIGKEILVIATSSNIEITADAAATARLFYAYNSFMTSVVLSNTQTTKFTYVGFGTGTGGTVDGYWRVE